MTEKELSIEEVEAFKKELAEIKADMMRKELEEIKKERMRKELEEIKAERASRTARQRPVYAPSPGPALSLVNLVLAALLLLIAGYLIGSAYGADVAGSVDGVLKALPFSLPIGSSLIVAALAIIFAALGIAVMTIVKK